MVWVVIFIAAFTAFIIFCQYQNNKIDVTRYEITTDRIKKDIRIVHLSDFHSKPFKKVIDITKENKPDIICITGDYINDREKNKNKMLFYAKRLVSTAPVYYITGNHEKRLPDFENLMDDLKQAGFNVLLNEQAHLDDITILGLDEGQADFSDYKARKKGTFVYKDMSAYFHRLEKANNFRLVLSHFPENFEGIKQVNYSQYDFELQLSGHAHGGQWIMPFIGPLFAPGQGIFPKYAIGSFGERPKLIVSRGLGNSEFPLRLFNHPEIIIIDLKKIPK